MLDPSQIPRTMDALKNGLLPGGTLHPGAQLFAMIDGQPVVDIALGQSQIDPAQPMRTDTLQLFLSAGKPLTAAGIAILQDRGLLTFDDPVVKHIPEFAANGKENITLRHLLTHTAGIRGLDAQYPFLTWHETLEKIYAMKPERDWLPGQKAGYHQHTSWYLLGEIIQRLTKEQFDPWMRREVMAPLNMDDVHFAFSSDEFAHYQREARWGIMYDTAPPKDAALSTKHLAFSIPNYDTQLAASRPRSSASARGPIKQLANFYEMLRHGGITADGRQMLQPDTVGLLTTRQRIGMFDHTFRQTIDWSYGLILNSAHYGPAIPYQFGPYASESTFGHGGSQSCTGFCDPEKKLVVSLLFNGSPGEPAHDKRLRATLKALYEDLGLV